MTDDQLKRAVLDLLKEVCGVPSAQLTASRHFFEYGMDSVSAVELVVMVEERFSIEIPDHVLSRFKCVDDVVKYLRARFDADPLLVPAA